jgi:hypothetical protein
MGADGGATNLLLMSLAQQGEMFVALVCNVFWMEETDEITGKRYWWNTRTKESV